VIAAAAAGWSLLAAVTGGVSFDIGLFPLSSRNPRNPALIALVMFVAAWTLAGRVGRREHLTADVQWTVGGLGLAVRWLWRAWRWLTTELETRTPPLAAPVCATVVAIAIIVTAVKESQFVASASDAWGYVSQAEMWATWTLRTPQPLMLKMNGFLPAEAMAPLAYRPTLDGSSIVPVTSPGVPMLMGVFQVIGGRPAVFTVVPLLAAVAIGATYLLGRTLSDRWTGVVAAVLVATSPAFLFQLTSSPMSDIPATAFWSLSLAFALRGQGGWSGVLAGIAILIRANLAPVAFVPATILLLHPAAAGGYGFRPLEAGVHGMLKFAAGVVPAAVTIAFLYNYWYGSPFNSGYGSLDQLYSSANIGPNLTRYSRWLLESQTPLILAGLLAPFLLTNRRGTLGLLAFSGTVLGCYVLYIPFDVWWYLRFLLPAFPALLVLTAAVLVSLARRLPPPLRVAAVVAVVAAVTTQTIGYAAARATFDSGGEQKYAITGRHVAEHLPANAVILSEIHSGSIRYYSGRTTIRFGSIPADHLEGAIAELQRLGYRPYLVAEDWEEDVFRKQFAGRRILSILDAGPEIELPLGHVRIYPLAR
jgi:hypothetical protein